ncbi:hypothetical protein JKF63_02516 [Porcisia hertigi]|uniref:Nudix hydrolase domain-containing protein n=1 Tax=Porcisia hertigi TaxID=2761500 RepID=A0A836I450_9TRYP|nr:hypothetical protein JKF63_02516 [Porcisia hertigi]
MASTVTGGVSASQGKHGAIATAATSIHAGRAQNEKNQLSENAKLVVVRGADGFAYRRSVQVFFVNERAEFLLCHPVGKGNENFRQTVQGGSEAGESPQQTAQRETWEEIGLDLDKDAKFVCTVLPTTTTAPEGKEEEEETRNDKNEITSERRKAFRYRSKTWRKLGIIGQELYPLLYMMEHSHLQRVDTHGQTRGVRDEFRSVEWGSLVDLVDKAPPAKKEVMHSVCRAVAAAAKPFLESRGYPTTGLKSLLSTKPPTS